MCFEQHELMQIRILLPISVTRSGGSPLTVLSTTSGMLLCAGCSPGRGREGGRGCCSLLLSVRRQRPQFSVHQGRSTLTWYAEFLLEVALGRVIKPCVCVML